MAVKPISIAQLIDMGLVKAGDEWRHVARDVSSKATVTKTGHLRLADGQEFRSPSTAATALTGSSRNGWVFWRYKKSGGEWRFVDELRKLARESAS